MDKDRVARGCGGGSVASSERRRESEEDTNKDTVFSAWKTTRKAPGSTRKINVFKSIEIAKKYKIVVAVSLLHRPSKNI